MSVFIKINTSSNYAFVNVDKINVITGSSGSYSRTTIHFDDGKTIDSTDSIDEILNRIKVNNEEK